MITTHIKSIRPFIGAKDFDLSSRFYREIGFEEIKLSQGFSVFKKESIAFYLQDAFVKDWIDNTMVFVEVEDTYKCHDELESLALAEKYKGARLSAVREMDWGRECFLHDPSGVLWHFGQFNG